MIESSAASYLLSYTGLTALVSTRINPVVLPTPATYPSVTYQKIGAEDELGMGQDSGICEGRLQFDCWGSTYSSTKSVAVQIKKAFKNFTGNMKGTYIHCCKLANETDTFTSSVFRTTLEFEFQYEE